MTPKEFKHILYTLKILVIFAAQLFFIDIAKGEEIQKDTLPILRAKKVLNGEWLYIGMAFLLAKREKRRNQYGIITGFIISLRKL